MQFCESFKDVALAGRSLEQQKDNKKRSAMIFFQSVEEATQAADLVRTRCFPLWEANDVRAHFARLCGYTCWEHLQAHTEELLANPELSHDSKGVAYAQLKETLGDYLIINGR